MLSLHVATMSVRVRCFDCESLRLLQNSFEVEEDLRSRNVLLSLNLLLHVSSTSL